MASHNITPVQFDGANITFHRGQHRHDAKNISQTMTSFCNKNTLNPAQTAAANRLKASLQADKSPAKANDVSTPWTKAEIADMFQSVDYLFFGGALRHCMYSYNVSDKFLQDEGTVGTTQSSYTATTVSTIDLFTFLNDRHWKTRGEARTRLIATMAHEALHMLFDQKVCRCTNCKAIVSSRIRPDGHGPYWLDPATAMSNMFLRVFGTVMEVSPRDPSVTRDPISSWELNASQQPSACRLSGFH